MKKPQFDTPQSRSLQLTGDDSRAHIDVEARTVELAFSSETPYERWYGMEVLDHSPDAINMERLNSGAPLLLGHGDARDQIGVVEKAWLAADRKTRARVRFSRSALGEEIFQDVVDDIRRLVSVGYSIEDFRQEGQDANGLDVFRMTRWTPFEISIVPVPADATVGVGRAHDTTAKPAGPSGDNQETAMSDAKQAAVTETQPAPEKDTRKADINAGVDHVALERERAKEIRALAREFNQVDMGDTAIDTGESVDAFRKRMLDKLKTDGTLRMAESPEIGMGKKEVQRYSFLRALMAAADPLHADKIAPYEMECSRAAQDKRGDSRDKTREAALTIPVDVLQRGMELPEGAAASARSRLIAKRDLVVGTASAGGDTVSTDLLSASFIDLLRNAMILDRLGATFLTDLNGNIAIPEQTGAATGYWVAESGAPTESQQTVGQIGMTPKTVGAFTDYSRRLLLQSSIDVEAFVRADLAAIIGLQIQLAAIQGGGTNEPTGILAATGIGSVPGGTNGGAPTYDHMVDLETAVAAANADMGSLAYLTNSKVRGTLRKTQEFAGTNGRAVWTSGADRGVGDVLGYDAVVSNAVPSDLTKGTGTNLSAIIFGNWADLMVGMWGGLDVMLDPYTGATSGTKRVVALQDVDVALRRKASFAAMTDAITA